MPFSKVRFLVWYAIDRGGATPQPPWGASGAELTAYLDRLQSGLQGQGITVEQSGSTFVVFGV
jgi:hypothetical protein